MNKRADEAVFTFKKLTESDLPLLRHWFMQPHVARWWPTLVEGEFLEKFLSRIKSNNTFGFMVSFNNKPIGYIQYYYLDRTSDQHAWLPHDLPPHTIGTDQFIGEADYIGKGYGPQFIMQFIEFIRVHEPEVTTMIVDPDPQNVSAIRAYEKVGFQPVGVFKVPGAEHLLMKYSL